MFKIRNPTAKGRTGRTFVGMKASIFGTSAPKTIRTAGIGPGRLVLGIAIFLSCLALRPGYSGPERQDPPSKPAAKQDLFVSSVRPILVQHCAPCHEPGGKLYDRLPFDQSQVVASHAAGVLKRLKGADREAVEKWLATLPPSPKP